MKHTSLNECGATTPLRGTHENGDDDNSGELVVESGGQGGGEVCGDTCQYSHDADCDDGGGNSDYDVCPLGSDCEIGRASCRERV